MDFPWLECTKPRANGADQRAKVAADELTHRAGLMYRLGFSQDAATKRLAARVAWEYDPASKHGAHRRHASLSNEAIAKIVADTYARRPG